VVGLCVAGDVAVGKGGKLRLGRIDPRVVVDLQRGQGRQGLHLFLAVGEPLRGQLEVEDARLQPLELELALHGQLLGIRQRLLQLQRLAFQRGDGDVGLLHHALEAHDFLLESSPILVRLLELFLELAHFLILLLRGDAGAELGAALVHGLGLLPLVSLGALGRHGAAAAAGPLLRLRGLVPPSTAIGTASSSSGAASSTWRAASDRRRGAASLRGRGARAVVDPLP
jgi:hypothetical protein